VVDVFPKRSDIATLSIFVMLHEITCLLNIVIDV
jgi:hypothetical protein